MSVKIGVIGGSGFYQMEGLTDVEAIEVETPFGKPSDSLVLGTIDRNARCVSTASRRGASAASVRD